MCPQQDRRWRTLLGECFRRFRPDGVLAVLVGLWLAVVLFEAATRPYEHIEEQEFIAYAKRVSWQHLPIREAQHASLPAYLIKASGLLFGETRFGFRLLSAVAGTCTILLIYRLGREWWGRPVGRCAALLLCVNEYHIAISARAIDLTYDLFFIALGMYAFARFLKSERPPWLYLAAVSVGLGFLCKEITCLMVPVFFVTLAVLPARRFLVRKEPWLAALLFFIVIAPDVVQNAWTLQPGRAYYYATYGDHLSRVGGVGFCGQPLVFYFGRALEFFGIPFENTFKEMPFMHPLAAVVLLGGVILVTLGKNKDPLAMFLLIMFWGIFGLFSLIVPKEPSRPELYLCPVMWYWVDRTTLPAALLAAFAICQREKGTSLIFGSRARDVGDIDSRNQ